MQMWVFCAVLVIALETCCSLPVERGQPRGNPVRAQKFHDFFKKAAFAARAQSSVSEYTTGSSTTGHRVVNGAVPGSPTVSPQASPSTGSWWNYFFGGWGEGSSFRSTESTYYPSSYPSTGSSYPSTAWLKWSTGSRGWDSTTSAPRNGGNEFDHRNWPMALMEHAEFLGRCEAERLFYAVLDMDPLSYGVLGSGCPWAYNISKVFMSATDEQRQQGEKLLESIMHIMQCGNVMAEMESLALWALVNDEDLEDNIYFMDAYPLLQTCVDVFGNMDKLIRRFDTSMKEVFEDWELMATKKSFGHYRERLTRILKTEEKEKAEHPIVI